MLPSVLIANRGEIAVRIIRTARRMGLRTIAVYSDADALAPHVRMADEAVHLGPAPALQSYLVAERILEAARRTSAASIHPGYGFLSENAEFADACKAAGVVFIGPPASAIRAMGLKDAAKSLMQKAGVPVTPGYLGTEQGAAFLAARAGEIGYPVLIKAVAGGGGKGMRKVERAEDFAEALASCQREAASSFGNDRVLIEKYITAPRHVEVQVFADNHGNAVHLFERDCSLQRRHQKVIEEAPAPGMTAQVRALMGKAAVEAAKAVGYSGAGTVEFIVDGARGLRPDGFWFMEMNTRLQVEHPVTEAITGLDLVEWQLRVASGEVLPRTQEQLAVNGHAVEARLYAEDPESGFLPSTGRLFALRLPKGEGVRVDSGVEQGGAVSPFYDPMIAKIIAHGATRDEALDRLARALGDTLVAGPRTNTAFLKALCEAPAFRAEKFDTGFIDRNLEALGATRQKLDTVAAARAVEALLTESEAARRARLLGPDAQAQSPWSMLDGFALAGAHPMKLRATINGEVEHFSAVYDSARPGRPNVLHDGARAPETEDVTIVAGDDAIFALRHGRQTEARLIDALDVDVEGGGAGDMVIKAPMHGKLVALLVKAGDLVEKGQRLAVVEAMKMEHALVAPRAGKVSETAGQVGAQVAQGAKIVVIHEE